MSESINEPTDDSVADGTQIPEYHDIVAESGEWGELEQGDAGVNDDGTEEWYDEGED